MSIRCRPGEQVVLGRYETEAGTRVLVGRRIAGVVHVYDFAVDQPQRAYFVEAGFDSKAELAATVADYLRQARLLGASPMGRRGLEHIAVEPEIAGVDISLPEPRATSGETRSPVPGAHRIRPEGFLG